VPKRIYTVNHKCAECTRNKAMHKPKTLRYQSHFKNIVKSINLTVRLKADNELKSIMLLGK